MNFRHLVAFESVARLQNFTRAAQELHISQPSLSILIKLLEEELECKLLERTTKKVSITEAGQVFYRHARDILEVFDNAKKEMRDVKTVGGGIINIGMIESSKYLVLQFIKEFKLKYKDISINFLEMESNAIEKAIEKYDIHFGVTSVGHSERFKTVAIYEEDLMLITPLDHRFRARKRINLVELKDEPIIQFPATSYISTILSNSTRPLGFDLTGKHKVERIETARILVEAGLGSSIVPASYLKHSSGHGVHLVRLEKPTPKKKVYVMYNEHRYLPPVVKEFIASLQEPSRGNQKRPG